MTRVAVSGAAGKMGRVTLRAIADHPELELVAAVDRTVQISNIQELDSGLPSIMLVQSLDGMAGQADVLVDFSHFSSAPEFALSAISQGICPVIGTSGLSVDDLERIKGASKSNGVSGAHIPNFALGAVLMMKFAELAAPFYSFSEVVEMHHEAKLDAPSGTAAHTADIIARFRSSKPDLPANSVEKVPGARGGEKDGVRVHSIRMPGYVASQEVIFGGKGERLSIRHDSIDRGSFMEGVCLAALKIREFDGFATGLDQLIFD